jgi:hypothetical protein
MDGDLMDGKTIALTLKLSHYLPKK